MQACQDRRHLHGHVRTLAETIAAEVKTSGAEVDLLQFPEILTEEIRGKMHAAPRAEVADVTPNDLTNYDGFLFGFPTRYGRAPAAVSSFFDATGGLWMKGALSGKFAGIFTSTASQHGGQETTALTTVPFFAHHGIIYVPAGFGSPDLSDNSEVVGGSAYGAAAIASGDGSRQLTPKELGIAKFQAQSFTKILNQFVAGKSALEKQTAEPTVAAGEPVLAKAVPTSDSTPYTVDESAAAPAEPKAAEPAAAPAPTEAAAPAPAAATEDKPAATPAPAPAKPQEKKKAGLFASCCGGSAKNYD
ncbi:hypothetical protein Rhopal_003793-T1 [Rhodotorula paludigena]|uniref:Flavodoxin-like domain-containing protein n=1 Tax=Rhodotorula paludigena TaxID=86838 RepID=A0AAV5GLK1_9BASI|nr:hypothetical protein Rhopal_003793-T1 [Rhodotorula paludigena]